MNVSDVMTRVRRTFGDQDDIQITGDDIMRWINDGQREMTMQLPDLLMSVGYLDTVVGQLRYTLPDDLLTLNNVYTREAANTAYYAMKWMSEAEFVQKLDGWDGDPNNYPYGNGIPMVYVKEGLNTLVVFPAPQASLTQGLKLTYARKSVDVTADTDPLDIPDYLHNTLVAYCLVQAYELDEDWESVQMKAQQFQNDINFNTNRESWFGRDSYPTIVTSYQDSESY